MNRIFLLVFVLGLLLSGVPLAAQNHVLSRQISGLENEIGFRDQELSGLQEQIDSLKEEITRLREEIDALKAAEETGEGPWGEPFNFTSNWRNFTFAWGPEAQDIVDGIFKIQVSVWFENHTSPWDNATYEMFYITLRVYDDDYYSDDYLGLVFDENHNGFIDLGHEDRPRGLYANNSTMGYAFLTKEGFMAPAEVPREKAYTCTYDPEKGYASGPFGGPTSDFASKFGDMPTYIPIHICFLDADLYPGVHGVSVQFRIYLDS